MKDKHMSNILMAKMPTNLQQKLIYAAKLTLSVYVCAHMNVYCVCVNIVLHILLRGGETSIYVFFVSKWHG